MHNSLSSIAVTSFSSCNAIFYLKNMSRRTPRCSCIYIGNADFYGTFRSSQTNIVSQWQQLVTSRVSKSQYSVPKKNIALYKKESTQNHTVLYTYLLYSHLFYLDVAKL